MKVYWSTDDVASAMARRGDYVNDQTNGNELDELQHLIDRYDHDN